MNPPQGDANITSARLINEGFETGDATGWGVPTPGLTITNTQAHSGTYSAEMLATALYNSYLNQHLGQTDPEGTWWSCFGRNIMILSFWSLGGNATDYYYVQYDDLTYSANQAWAVEVAWTQHNIKALIPDGKSFYGIYFAMLQAVSLPRYIDDVILRPSPLPQSLVCSPQSVAPYLQPPA